MFLRRLLAVLALCLVLLTTASALPPQCGGACFPYVPGMPPLRLNCSLTTGYRVVEAHYYVNGSTVTVVIPLSSVETGGIPPRCVPADCPSCGPVVFANPREVNATIVAELPVRDGGWEYFTPGESVRKSCIAWYEGGTAKHAPTKEGSEFCLICLSGGNFTAYAAKVCSAGSDAIVVSASPAYSLAGVPLLPLMRVEVVAPEGATLLRVRGVIGDTRVESDGPFTIEAGPLKILRLMLEAGLALRYELEGEVLREAEGSCVLTHARAEGAISLLPYLLWFAVVVGCAVLAVTKLVRRHHRVEELDLV